MKQKSAKKKAEEREPCVAVTDLWTRLKAAGIDLPANVSRIIIDCPCGDVVRIHWSTYADKDAMEVIADVIVDVQKGKRVRVSPATPE